MRTNTMSLTVNHSPTLKFGQLLPQDKDTIEAYSQRLAGGEKCSPDEFMDMLDLADQDDHPCMPIRHKIVTALITRVTNGLQKNARKFLEQCPAPYKSAVEFALGVAALRNAEHFACATVGQHQGIHSPLGKKLAGDFQDKLALLTQSYNTSKIYQAVEDFNHKNS